MWQGARDLKALRVATWYSSLLSVEVKSLFGGGGDGDRGFVKNGSCNLVERRKCRWNQGSGTEWFDGAEISLVFNSTNDVVEYWLNTANVSMVAEWTGGGELEISRYVTSCDGWRGLIEEITDNSLSCRKPIIEERLVAWRRSSSMSVEKVAGPMWDWRPSIWLEHSLVLKSPMGIGIYLGL